MEPEAWSACGSCSCGSPPSRARRAPRSACASPSWRRATRTAPAAADAAADLQGGAGLGRAQDAADVALVLGAAPNFEDDDDELESGEGFDASGWLERGRDEIKQETATDSVELYLFKTAALVLENMSALGALHLIEEPVVKFFFVSLEKAATLSAQRCAAVCCSVLSREHLHLLVACFFERQTKVPEKKFRWLLYQQATQMLAFGVASQEQAEVTVRFLEAMQKKMEKTDRGKLPAARCAPRSRRCSPRS